MMLRNKKVKSIMVIVIMVIARYVWKSGEFYDSLFAEFYIKISLTYLIPIIIVALSLLLFISPNNVLSALGLNGNIFKALVVAFVFTMPMLIGYGIVANLNSELTFDVIYHRVVLAAFTEEVLFRGFLFGILYRFAGWGFIPAAIISALLFASGHLYQADSFGSAIGVFCITLMGGLWFSWLYIEWNKNLWIAIFLHLFMNFYWGLFSIADNAAGGLYANVFRTLTIAFSVLATVYMITKRKHFEISKSKLWFHKKNDNHLFINQDA